jgi:hypothetical protein
LQLLLHGLRVLQHVDVARGKYRSEQVTLVVELRTMVLMVEKCGARLLYARSKKQILEWRFQVLLTSNQDGVQHHRRASGLMDMYQQQTFAYGTLVLPTDVHNLSGV